MNEKPEPAHDQNDVNPGTAGERNTDTAKTEVTGALGDTAIYPTEAFAPSGTPSSAAYASYAGTTTPERLRPPIRWAGIVWGILLIAFAGGVLTIISSPTTYPSLVDALTSLAPGTAQALWLAAVGLVIAVSAILAAISASQRRRRNHPA